MSEQVEKAMLQKIQDLTVERDCWITNAKNLQEGYNKLDKELTLLKQTNANNVANYQLQVEELGKELTQLRADCEARSVLIKKILDTDKAAMAECESIGIGMEHINRSLMNEMETVLATHPGTPLLDELKELRDFVKFVSTYDDEVGETANQLLTKWEKKV